MSTAMTALLLFLLMLGVARVTWLITEDHLPLVQRPRDWIIRRNPNGNLAYLVNCWFCTSVYTGLIAAEFWVWVFDLPLGPLNEWQSVLLLWPALSFGAVGIMGAIDWLTNAPDHD